METTISDSTDSFIKRHPLTTYYALTFAISWGSLLIVAGPGGIPGTSEQVARLFPIALLALFAGPSVGGIVSTGLVYGRAGLRELLSRLFRWRVGARWYAVALLTIWVLATPILFALSLRSPVFLPGIVTTADKTGLMLSAVLMGLVGAFLEELGWTGFAAPGLRSRYGVLATGLIVGFLWGAWHVPITFWSTGTWTLFVGPLFFYAAVLPTYRVLMVWVYHGTMSILVPMLMHASLIASTTNLLLTPAQGAPLVTYYLILAAALIFAATAALTTGRLEKSNRPRSGWLERTLRVLVAYASKAGSTKGIAEFIGDKLRERGIEASVVEVGAARDVEAYDAFVIGSAVYQFHWLKEAKQFVSRNRSVLAGRSVWLFSSGPTGSKPTDSKGRDLREVSGPKELEELREWINPRDHQVFFGALYRDRLKGTVGWFARWIPNEAEGDFRNWKEIEAWVTTIAQTLRA